jgi:hypothetical protein
MLSVYILEYEWIRIRRVRDRMVIGIITTYAISAHYHKCCKLESRPSEMYSIPHYVMKFVSDLRQVANFLRVLRFPPPIILTSVCLYTYEFWLSLCKIARSSVILLLPLFTYSWTIVESSVKHHKLTLNTELISLKKFKIVSIGTKAM